jgi:hypothetical protein
MRASNLALPFGELPVRGLHRGAGKHHSFVRLVPDGHRAEGQQHDHFRRDEWRQLPRTPYERLESGPLQREHQDTTGEGVDECKGKRHEIYCVI